MKKKLLSEELSKLSLLTERLDAYREDKKFTPSDIVANACKNALAELDKSSIIQNTHEGSGREKAVELSNKTPQNMAQVKKMNNFFNKNENLITKIKNQGGPKTDSDKAIMQAWNLHGGDAGRQWAKNQLTQHHDIGMRKSKLLRHAGGASTNKGTGVFDSSILDATKQRIHRAK